MVLFSFPLYSVILNKLLNTRKNHFQCSPSVDGAKSKYEDEKRRKDSWGPVFAATSANCFCQGNSCRQEEAPSSRGETWEGTNSRGCLQSIQPRIKSSGLKVSFPNNNGFSFSIPLAGSEMEKFSMRATGSGKLSNESWSTTQLLFLFFFF